MITTRINGTTVELNYKPTEARLKEIRAEDPLRRKARNLKDLEATAVAYVKAMAPKWGVELPPAGSYTRVRAYLDGNKARSVVFLKASEHSWRAYSVASVEVARIDIPNWDFEPDCWQIDIRLPAGMTEADVETARRAL